MTGEMTVENQGELVALSVAEVQARVRRIQEIKKSVMKEGEHYGRIPGTSKDCLYKSGAEQLLMTFKIATSISVEDLSGPDERRYRVKVKGLAQGGDVLGDGIGECSTSESKFKWRTAVSDAEFAATPEDKRRVKYERSRTISQVRTAPEDLANTVLKMAKKRALVDMCLTVTAASDLFTQDVEEQGSPIPVAASSPIPTTDSVPPASHTNIARFIPEELDIRSGTNKNGKPYTSYIVKSSKFGIFSTFNEDFGRIAQDAADNNKEVEITFDKNGKYNNLTGIKVIDSEIKEKGIDESPLPETEEGLF